MDDLRSTLESEDKTDDKELVQKWLQRAKTAQKFHTKELLNKYRVALRRYNSEIDFSYKQKSARHVDVNLLFKNISDFTASVFFRNPQIDLTSRSDDPQSIRRIENLEAKCNACIRDDAEMKEILETSLVDEYLASLGAVYIDYEFRSVDSTEQIGEDENGQPIFRQIPQVNKPVLFKILPENLIKPPYIRQYNADSATYLGYYDILPLEQVKQDQSFDPAVVADLKGAEYFELMEKELRNYRGGSDYNDETKHVGVYVIFFRETKDAPMKRLVISDDEGCKGRALSYSDWDRGHRGLPIHFLMLNKASSDRFMPPSEAWKLEPLLEVISYIVDKLYRHLKKSTTKTFVKTGEGGLTKTEFDKLVENVNRDVIGVKDMPAGTDIRSIVQQVSSEVLSNDHSGLYAMTMEIFNSISRRPQFANPMVINQKKTATETQAIEQADTTTNGQFIYRFQKFLKAVFLDYVLLYQRNYQGGETVIVETQEGNEEAREITSEDMQGDFEFDIRVESFIEPNKAVKRRIVKETLGELTMLKPLLDEQGLQLNAKKIVDEYIQNVDLQNADEILIPKQVRSLDQQINDAIFNNVPFNVQELTGDPGQNLARAGEIYQNQEQMTVYEQLKPGIAQGLEQLMMTLNEAQNPSGKGPKQSSAETEAGLSGAALAGQ